MGRAFGPSGIHLVEHSNLFFFSKPQSQFSTFFIIVEGGEKNTKKIVCADSSRVCCYDDSFSETRISEVDAQRDFPLDFLCYSVRVRRYASSKEAAAGGPSIPCGTCSNTQRNASG
jgi:hypothetical protein